MQVELEAKFIVGHDDARRRLAAAGFSCSQPLYLMRRVVFDVPAGGTQAWARVRDEAGVITVSYKRTRGSARVDGTDEIQIVADDFDRACGLLEACGLVRKSYQETWREVWQHDRAEVALDEWPCLSPFVEIEAPDEETLKAVAGELGFDWAQAIFGPVGVLYEAIGIPAAAINGHPRVTFDNTEDVMRLKRA